MTFSPLSGVVVLDLSRYLPGPFLTRILADLGADVWKVEPPQGDPLRWMPPLADATGGAFASLHAGKRSVVLDLKRSEAVAVLRAMAARADVLIESNRPGVLARLGLAPEALWALNPALIIASLSGFGQHGPRAQQAGHDLGYQALSGALAEAGPAGAAPWPTSVQVADLAGGAWPAAVGILGALREREETGRGRHLDISLARGAFSLTTLSAALADAGVQPSPGEGALTGALPCYRCYRTADGRSLSVAALEPQFWARVCAVLGRPDWVDRGLATGEDGAALIEALQALFLEHPLAVWVARFEGVDACVTPVATLTEAMSDPTFSPLIDRSTGTLVVRAELGAPGELPTLQPVPALGGDQEAAWAAFGVPAALVDAAAAAGAWSTSGVQPG
jgi:alpha-methylacyl-CoA racemase